MKKTLALLLCAILVLALVPVVAIPAAAAGNVVYVKDGGTGDGSTADNAVGTIADAYNALDLSKDCTIVVCGPLTFPETTVSYGTEYTGSVTITSSYGGTNYDATISLSAGSTPRFRLWGTTVFENITLRMEGKFYLVICQFHNFKIAESVKMEFANAGTSGQKFDSSFNVLVGYQQGEGDALLKDDPDSTVEIYAGDKILLCEYNRGGVPVYEYTGTHHSIIGGNAKVVTYYNASVGGKAEEVKYGHTILTVKDNAVLTKLASTEGGINTMNTFTLNWLGGTISEVTDLNRKLNNPIGDRTERTLYTEGTKLVYNDTTAAAANFATISGLFNVTEKDGAASGTDTPAAPTKVEVPARPTLTSEKVIYQGFNNGADANDGLTKATAKKTYGKLASESGIGIVSLLDEGGKVVIISKSYIGEDGYTIPAFGGNTVLFTAKDVDGTSCIGKDPNDASGQGQWGYIMVINAGHAKVAGNIILREIGLLDRTPTTKPQASGWEVLDGATLVVEDTVVFAGINDGYAAPDLIVDEGGYAYLDTLGFLKYTGKGTIVVNNKLVDKVTKDDFAGFEGTICDEDGNVLFASAPAPVNPTPTPATGSMTVVIAAGAILASLGAIVALKKREER